VGTPYGRELSCQEEVRLSIPGWIGPGPCRRQPDRSSRSTPKHTLNANEMIPFEMNLYLCLVNTHHVHGQAGKAAQIEILRNAVHIKIVYLTRKR